MPHDFIKERGGFQIAGGVGRDNPLTLIGQA